MAPLLEDPRIRQTWNQFSQNAEHATENAAAGIWNFQHNYINPCFSGIGNALDQCTSQCFPGREERARRSRERRTRGRAELSFDFYDDWDEDDGLGGWGNDELDRLLTGGASHSAGGDINEAPKRKRGMSYGTRGRKKGLEGDPTIIPSTSALGFLGRLPWKLGGPLRYKPSAADLQEHPYGDRSGYGASTNAEDEEALLGGDDVEYDGRGHRRNRSSTASSGETTSDSFRSRGDLFPSDEEDAVPLGDEFAMALERRATNTGMDDRSSGKTTTKSSKKGKKVSRRGTQTSQLRPGASSKAGSGTSLTIPDLESVDADEEMEDLRAEEERIRMEEDAEVERKRVAAGRLALQRGLSGEGDGAMDVDVDILVSEPKHHEEDDMQAEEVHESAAGGEEMEINASEEGAGDSQSKKEDDEDKDNSTNNEFVPARLPNFG